jgi:hypothetical protein
MQCAPGATPEEQLLGDPMIKTMFDRVRPVLALTCAGLTVSSAAAQAVASSLPAPAWRGAPVREEALSALRGGAAVDNSIVSNGSVRDTSATNVVTGSNSISEGSFANASGLPTVIQNTGANVLIQNSTIVNVQFKP